MSEFNPGLPSVRQIQNFIKNKSYIEVGLITNQTIDGKVLWQDAQCLCLQQNQSDDKTLIRLQAIAYIKPLSAKSD
jgi:host factor-I protein